MSTGRAAATMAAGRMGRWLVAELAGAGVVALDRRRPESGDLDLPAVDRIRLPAAWHRTERYANNRVEADHGRLKARLRPMRGLKKDASARVIIAGHAFVQNLRRGRYELAAEEPVNRRVAIAFAELAVAI